MLRVIYRREFHLLLDRALRPKTRQAYFDAFGSWSYILQFKTVDLFIV
jgi:hypothetical protein